MGIAAMREIVRTLGSRLIMAYTAWRRKEGFWATYYPSGWNQS